jgi:LPS-assembly protein
MRFYDISFLDRLVNDLFIEGTPGRSRFALTSYYFQGLSSYDLQAQQPVVGPVWDYNKSIALPAARTGGVGGELEIDANFTHLNRELASFQAKNTTNGMRTLDNAFSLYDVCPVNAPSALYTRANCLIRGVGGDYTRATASATWKRQFIDPIGQVWTPFALADQLLRQ